jgi:hypothetical protein
MKRSLLICTFLIIHAGYALADEPKTVTIPLDQIWAWQMPGTRDVRQLEPEKFGEALGRKNSAEQLRISGTSMTSEVLRSLTFLKPGQTTKPGFVVPGIGLEALRNAHAVMTGVMKPHSSFRTASQASLVFFGHESGYYVYLEQVERQPGKITVRYRLVPHETKEMTRHFALVPLEKLEPGEIHVEFVQSPMEKHLVDMGFKPAHKTWQERIICQPFSFRIEGM